MEEVWRSDVLPTLQRESGTSGSTGTEPNLAAAKDPNKLRPIELVDPETGRTELAYRRE
jgi:hypothetical protein